MFKYRVVVKQVIEIEDAAGLSRDELIEHAKDVLDDTAFIFEPQEYVTKDTWVKKK